MERMWLVTERVAVILSIGGFHPTLSPANLVVAVPWCPVERECVSVSNVASTMITLMVGNPLLPVLDFSSLRLLSCGGSPQSPATIAKAIAAFGCEFFVSPDPRRCLIGTVCSCHKVPCNSVLFDVCFACLV